MSPEAFARIMAYLEVAVNKSLSADAAAVYFDLLADLPEDVLQAAAKRVALSHKWATFPSVAEIREAAVETIQGQANEMPPAEAWELAWKTAQAYDPNQQGEWVSNGVRYPSLWVMISEGLPPLVCKAMNAYGIRAMCFGGEPIGVIRAQFTKIYEQLAGAEKKRALLPAALRREIEAIGKREAIPAPVQKIIANLGAIE